MSREHIKWRDAAGDRLLKHTCSVVQCSRIDGTGTIYQLSSHAIHRGGNGVGSAIHDGPRMEGVEAVKAVGASADAVGSNNSTRLPPGMDRSQKRVMQRCKQTADGLRRGRMQLGPRSSRADHRELKQSQLDQKALTKGVLGKAARVPPQRG